MAVENRRDLPRIEAEFPVTVLAPEGEVIFVEADNVSRGGMQISCDRLTAEALVLRGSVVSPDAGAEFDLRWELPPGPVEARARLAWSRPAGDAGHRLGLQFLELPARSRRRLDRFVEHALRPDLD